VKKRLDNAALNMQVSKQLEERELALLERVSATYNTEKKMVESLQKINQESPVMYDPNAHPRNL
jgi:hypothetical protein